MSARDARDPDMWGMPSSASCALEVVFIANRGEIAARIARTVRALGWRSVGVFAPIDALSPHRFLTDRCLPLADAQGYSDAGALLAQAKHAGATMVHPGYGFLSQDEHFAEAVAASGLAFVGPCGQAMAKVGDKARARALAARLGLPTIAGGQPVATVAEAEAAATELGFPLLFKATNAGGGRGLARVDRASDVATGYLAASRVAGSAGAVLAERWLTEVRHIEVQVVGDGARALALGTRDCSSQRRLQKVIEEAPAAAVPMKTRAALEAAAALLLAAAQYRGAGTVEFLCTKDGQFFVLEVNPRLQVEHPVTEACQNLDLVAWQLALAGGAKLPQEAPQSRGHAIEVRLNAERPSEHFAPSTGTIEALQWPSGPGIRVDAGIQPGSQVGGEFDSLLAKIVAWAPTRAMALRRLLAALDEVVVMGIEHNLAWLKALLASERFVANDLDTSWVACEPGVSDPRPPPSSLACAIDQCCDGQAGGGAEASPAAWGPVATAAEAVASGHRPAGSADPLAEPFARSDAFGWL